MSIRISALAAAIVTVVLAGCTATAGSGETNRTINGTNIGSLTVKETSTSAGRFVIPETSDITISKLEVGGYQDGRYVETARLNRGVLRIESMGGDTYFRPMTESTFVRVADAIAAKSLSRP